MSQVPFVLSEVEGRPSTSLRTNGSFSSDCPSTIFILPMPLLSLGEPFDCSGDALGAGGVLLRVGDPVEIVAPRARAEAVERRLGLGTGIQRGGEFGVKLGRRLGLMLDLARRWGGRCKLDRLTDQRVELRVGRQVGDGGPPPELAHRPAARLAA